MVSHQLKSFVAVLLADKGQPASELIYNALCMLQHRGQDAAGIVTADNLGADAVAKLTGFYDAFKVLPGIKEYLAKRDYGGMGPGIPGSKANPA